MDSVSPTQSSQAIREKIVRKSFPMRLIRKLSGSSLKSPNSRCSSGSIPSTPSTPKSPFSCYRFDEDIVELFRRAELSSSPHSASPNSITSPVFASCCHKLSKFTILKTLQGATSAEVEELEPDASFALLAGDCGRVAFDPLLDDSFWPLPLFSAGEVIFN
ncbi:hypothetical protein HUJ05_010376 [Dendroctonus ponderosae]|nr:hypothetical protein HUJ05_010376 [Dendroctonus ponderosae]